MKKIFKFMLLAIAGVFALASCEDVPMPYSTPNLAQKGQEGLDSNAKGTGTLADPFNVAGVKSFIDAGEYSGKTVYFTGIVTSFASGEEPGNSYGNATFYIADEAEGTNTFYCYRIKSFNNQKFTSADASLFGIGDTVTVCGNVTLFKGNTYETEQNTAYLVGVNGNIQGGDQDGEEPDTPDLGDAEGDGKTIQTAYNVAAAYALCASLEKSTNAQDRHLSEEVYVKGIISKIDNVDTGNYGNATYYISTDGTEAGQFEVYRGYALGGEKFKAADEINVGDNVVVCGNLVNWMGTYEFNQGSKIVLLNDKTVSEEPSDPSNPGEPSVNATEITCAQAVALTNAMDENETTEETYAITGYITEVVGNVNQNQQTFWMADTKDGGKVFEAYYANLPAGTDKFVTGSKVKITGNIMKFVNKNDEVTPEIKNAKVEILEKAEGGNTDDNTSDNPGDISGEVSGNSITFSTMGYENALDFDGKSITVGDAVVAFSKGSGSTTPKYYNTGTAMRLYGGNTMKISSTKSITKITFKYATGEDQNKRPYYATASNISVSPDSYDYTTQTWSGNSREITVNYTAQGGHVRILGLEITYAN